MEERIEHPFDFQFSFNISSNKRPRHVNDAVRTLLASNQIRLYLRMRNESRNSGDNCALIAHHALLPSFLVFLPKVSCAGTVAAGSNFGVIAPQFPEHASYLIAVKVRNLADIRVG